MRVVKRIASDRFDLDGSRPVSSDGLSGERDLVSVFVDLIGDTDDALVAYRGVLTAMEHDADVAA